MILAEVGTGLEKRGKGGVYSVPPPHSYQRCSPSNCSKNLRVASVTTLYCGCGNESEQGCIFPQLHLGFPSLQWCSGHQWVNGLVFQTTDTEAFWQPGTSLEQNLNTNWRAVVVTAPPTDTAALTLWFRKPWPLPSVNAQLDIPLHLCPHGQLPPTSLNEAGVQNFPTL